MLGEHFDGSSEFLIEAGNETTRPISLDPRELDLVAVECQAVDQRLLLLAGAESIIRLEI